MSAPGVPSTWAEFAPDGLTVINVLFATEEFIAEQQGDFAEVLPPGLVVSPGDEYNRVTHEVHHKGSIPPDAPITAADRAAAAALIDARTDQLIELGFEYPTGSGRRFSLSSVGQRNLLGSYAFKDSPYFSYPVRWATLHDDAVIYLADANEVAVFCLTALATVRGFRDSGSALKEQVVLAQTGAELAAVIDTR